MGVGGGGLPCVQSEWPPLEGLFPPLPHSGDRASATVQGTSFLVSMLTVSICSTPFPNSVGIGSSTGSFSCKVSDPVKLSQYTGSPKSHKARLELCGQVLQNNSSALKFLGKAGVRGCKTNPLPTHDFTGCRPQTELPCQSQYSALLGPEFKDPQVLSSVIHA